MIIEEHLARIATALERLCAIEERRKVVVFTLESLKEPPEDVKGPPPPEPPGQMAEAATGGSSGEPPTEQQIQIRCLALVRKDLAYKADITRLLALRGAQKLKDLTKEQRIVFSLELATVEAAAEAKVDA